ncbi:hypothetical protein HJG54_17825 [Leptolyngbya sp. NK1-12]|uniref:Uncharacterized protein n=1 Tax=Leptolyngbya sp. NK1-12 TaxID=2547451 RepID=A0AA97AQZ8_9CYAN|nr:hypothetical protein [Leptolyngbya sp. NK1-12]WNZ24528.1 hypothetical protein HJG54_17825 [Leptolyngbya sp. NK1-12]
MYAEYGCWPIWGIDEIYNGPPEKFPLRQETIARLNAWQDAYNTAYNSDYPDEWGGFPSQEAHLDWRREGLKLWKQMQQELGAEHDVYYSAYFDGRPQLIYRSEELPDELKGLLDN